MTGRQSVPGLKGPAAVGSSARQLACSFIPVLLINIRGVRGAIGETCSSTQWWPLLLGLWPLADPRVGDAFSDVLSL